MIKEKIYREEEGKSVTDEMVVAELARLEKERLIKISEYLIEVPVEKFVSQDKLMALLNRSNFTTGLLNTLGSLVVICNIGSFLGIPILGNELFKIGKKVSRANKTLSDFSLASEYMVYLRDEIDVEDLIISDEKEIYIYEGIGGILLLNIISEKVKIRIAPNFINILKNIGLRPTEMLEVIRAFSKRNLAADLDPLFDGTLSHDERIRTIETLKGSLMTTFLTMSEIGAYDKIAEMREENKIFKKMLNVK